MVSAIIIGPFPELYFGPNQQVVLDTYSKNRYECSAKFFEDIRLHMHFGSKIQALRALGDVSDSQFTKTIGGE
jgi:hypothetical protein